MVIGPFCRLAIAGPTWPKDVVVAQRVDRDAVVDADAALVRGESVPSERAPLSRDRILATGVAFLDERALSDLTMRRLGQTLGVQAMSLYRYVSGREELLDGIVERLIAQMNDDPDVLDTPRDGWQDFLQRLAHGVRRIALAHPKAFPLVASRPTEAPWIRPPLRNLATVEMFLDGLLSEGFSNDAAVAAYRAFTSFLLGHLLLEVAALGADIGPLDILAADDERPRLQPYPNVRLLGPQLAEDHSGTEFDEALESLLDRLTLLRAGGASH